MKTMISYLHGFFLRQLIEIDLVMKRLNNMYEVINSNFNVTIVHSEFFCIKDMFRGFIHPYYVVIIIHPYYGVN